MYLELTHDTDIVYDAPITESVMELRVTPRQDQDQLRLGFTLAIGPPAGVSSYFDWLGNTVHTFAVNPSHERIRIVAKSIVQTDRPTLDLLSIRDTWPVDAEYDPSLYDFLRFGGPVVDDPALRELVTTIRPTAGEPVGELVQRAVDLLHGRFVYEKGVTTAASPLTDMLTTGKGVCQDFTHLMIGLTRAMGIPARYVSGLVHPDRERFVGASETHAWCELLLGDSGWVGIDPTNNVPVGSNFIKVGVGRDFRDVPPNKGVYRGAGKERIEVKVTSTELDALPPEMKPERVQAIPIPTTPAGRAFTREDAGQQQQQQQQQ